MHGTQSAAKRSEGKQLAQRDREEALAAASWPGTSASTFHRTHWLDGQPVEILSVKGGSHWVYDPGLKLAVVAETEDVALLRMASSRASRRTISTFEHEPLSTDPG
jgi:hypothetical protein